MTAEAKRKVVNLSLTAIISTAFGVGSAIAVWSEKFGEFKAKTETKETYYDNTIERHSAQIQTLQNEFGVVWDSITIPRMQLRQGRHGKN